MSSSQTTGPLGRPIKINKLTLANRMVMAPMAAHSSGPDGEPSDETLAFFEARARGGVGMIIVGGMASSPTDAVDMPKSAGLRIDDDGFVPGLRRLGDTVHAHNVPIIAELVPSLGRMNPFGQRMSASPINVVIPEHRLPRRIHAPGKVVTPVPQEAPLERIKLYEQELMAAGERAQRAGWDGVEVAAHMAYFAASFLTPRTNWRTDEYGGSIENRARMLVNIVTGIRQRVGRDFIVGLRITSNEYLPDGQGAEGYAAIAKLVEAAGIDYVALSPGTYETMNIAMSDVDGWMVDNGDARLFKQTLSVPVFLQGIHDPVRAAQAIADGDGDVIMLGRSLLADPDYARKVLEGRGDAIAMCKRDNYCMRRFIVGMPIRCEVNRKLGTESFTGGLPPIGRILRKPVEEVIVKAIGSPRLMKLVAAVKPKSG